MVGIFTLILFLCSFSFAVEQHNTVFPITETETYYSAADNFYDSTDTQRIRFEYLSNYTGECQIDIGDTTNFLKYFYFYGNDNTFSSYTKYDYKYGRLEYNFNCTKGEKYYFILYSSLSSETSYYFNIKVNRPHQLTVETSKQCTTSVTSAAYLDSSKFTIYGYGKAGFRPNGWKIQSGNTVAIDSSSYLYNDTITTDTKIKLNCKEKKLIEITDKEKTYTYINDFAEIQPNNGLEFRFQPKDTKIYQINVKSNNTNSDYFYNYKNDSSFTTYTASRYLNNKTSHFFVTQTKADESFYFKLTPRYNNFTDSITVVAKQASIMHLDTNPEIDTDALILIDTVGIGDSAKITYNLKSGENFVKWYIVSGKGKFVDSTSQITYFIPKSSRVVLATKVKKIPIYELDKTYSKFSYKKNSSKTQNSSYYGIRSSYIAKDSGSYAIIVKSDTPSIYAFTDTSFRSTTTNPSKKCYQDSCKYVFTSTPKTNYFLIQKNSEPSLNDSTKIKVIKTFEVKASVTGNGTVTLYDNLTGSSQTSVSSFISGDTVTLLATPDKEYKFKKWKVTSGSCKINDENTQNTFAIVNGNCEIKATFVEGTVYLITEAAKSYSYNKDYYAQIVKNGNTGVRFSFYAPSDGLYTFNFSTNEASDYFYIYKYLSFDSITVVNSYSFKNSIFSDTITMAKGDSIFYNVYPRYYNSNDSATVFWVNYSTKTSYLGLSADSNGSVTPAYYSQAQVKAMNPISAQGATGYKFKNWETLTNNVKIDNPTYYKTFAAVTNTDSAKIIAHFEEGTVKTLSTKKQTFNFRDDYYSESTGSAIRFKWTPTDTNTHILQFHQVDSLYANYNDYGTSSFGSYQDYASFTGNKSFFVKGDSTTHYYTLKSNFSNIPDYSFTAQIVDPVVLNILSEESGTASPFGKIEVIPNEDTTISAAPFGGYTFKSWEIVNGKAKIGNAKNAKTQISIDSACTIQATYTLDLTTEPKLIINGLDLTNHPGICAEVSVTDSKNGRPIYGLDSSDFILSQDSKTLPIQVTSVEEVNAFSAVLVVDESGSMDGVRNTQAKESMRQFVNGMGPEDRAAIVGFTSSAHLIQRMTSNKDSLLKGINNVNASGGTTINYGADLGLDQIKGETNATAVIIFSDGDGSGGPSNSSIIEKALSLQTTIYSIAIGGTYTDPLKIIAEGTGGTYTYAPTAAELATIYADVRRNVKSRYVICYQSPDEKLNGDEHEVIISTSFLNKTAKDTAYWKEDFMPPSVRLTQETWDMVGKSQPAGDTLVLGFYITSKTPIATAKISIRKSDPTKKDFQTYDLIHVTDSLGNSDSLWQFVVPAKDVVYPGLDFYAIVTDSAKFTGRSPKTLNPSKEPYTIPINNDLPQVTLKSATCMDSTSGLKTFKFDIYDSNGVLGAQIYYKDSASVLYKEISLTREKNLWTADVPAGSDKFNKLNYYVRAQDSVGTLVRFEKEGFFTSEVCPIILYVDTLENISDTIKIVNADSKKEPISRATEKLKLKVSTEDFTDETDTIKVTLSCLVSGDIEHDIKLVEKEPGKFETIKSIPKNEYSPKKDNGSISCAGLDTLVAVYKDPAFGDFARDTVIISNYVKTTYEFRKVTESGKKKTLKITKDILDSVETTKYADFGLYITTTSPKANKVDSIDVLLFTQQGDSITVKAVETGKNTAEFEYIGRFYFAEDSLHLEKDKLDATLDFEKFKNRIKILPMITTDSSSTQDRDSLIIYNNYIPADSAEIYDRDLDGKADSIRIHFKEDLENVISSIDSVFWNKGSGEWRKVKSKSIKINKKDSEWIEARLEKQFNYAVTSADTLNQPYLRMTKTASDFSQKVYIADKMGVVPMKVKKKPGTVQISDYLSPDMQIPPDTLFVTLSEKVNPTGKGDVWKKLFRYSKSCDDTTTRAVKLAEEPTVDSTGLEWKLVLDDYNIIVGNCLRTNPNAEYEDEFGNTPSRGGKEITGKNGKTYLYEVTPSKPISGMGKSVKWLPPGKDAEWEEVPDTLTTIYVSSVAAYTAQVHIYDAISTYVTSFTQEFGVKVNKNGESEELNDPKRLIPGTRSHISYLSWNQRSDDDRKVGTGVYIWKITFIFDNGKHTETRTLRTGVKRNKE